MTYVKSSYTMGSWKFQLGTELLKILPEGFCSLNMADSQKLFLEIAIVAQDICVSPLPNMACVWQQGRGQGGVEREGEWGGAIGGRGSRRGKDKGTKAKGGEKSGGSRKQRWVRSHGSENGMRKGGEGEERKVAAMVNLCAHRWPPGLKWQTSWSKAN